MFVSRGAMGTCSTADPVVTTEAHPAPRGVQSTQAQVHGPRRVQPMAKHLIRWTALCGLLAGIILSGASRGAQADDLTGTLGERLWYYEAEFTTTPGLRARPHQVVILHLTPEDKGGKPIRKTIPYIFTETA